MNPITANIIGEKIFSNTKEAHNLFSTKQFGEKTDEKIFYSLPEAFFLLEEKKMQLQDYNGHLLSEKVIQKKLSRIDKQFFNKYLVFKDLRKKGYIVKTALKFGAEFRVYKKNNKIKEKHATWILFPTIETKTYSWHDFAAKTRVAHAAKKKVLLAIVDEENSISYYEINWLSI